MFADPMLGKYHLIAEIARGGMGVVYLALNQGPSGFSKLVVVKELKGELIEDPSFLTMFLDEARLAARLNHPNIVQTNEVGSDNERHFMAMEYLDGRTYERIRRRAKHVGESAFTLQMQLHVLCDVLGALDYAHKLTDFDGTPLHVVHRDVSPNNVFITFDGHVKVLDFGIAKAADHHHETQAGAVKGKLSYMAPEQARGQKVDARADVFSVGVMLWEAVAARRLRTGGREELLQIAGGEEPPRLSTVVPHVNPALERIVARALAPKREHRFGSAGELQTALEGYMIDFGTSTSARDLAHAVTGLFADERGRINALIEAQVTRARAGQAPTSSLPVIEMGGSNPPPVATPVVRIPSPSGSFSAQPESAPGGRSGNTGSLPPSQSGNNVEAAASLSASLPSVTPPPAAGSRIWLVAAVAVAAIAIGAVTLRRGDAPKPPPPPVAAVDPAPVRAVETPASPPASPVSAPAAREPVADVQIRVSPAIASITVDGALVAGNPFRGRYRADGVMHRIRAEAPGFRPTTRDVAFEGNVQLELDLEEIDRAVARKPLARTTPRPLRPEIAAPMAAPPVEPKPAPPEVKPDVVVEPKPEQINPQGGQKPRRAIDAKNPYQ